MFASPCFQSMVRVSAGLMHVIEPLEGRTWGSLLQDIPETLGEAGLGNPPGLGGHKECRSQDSMSKSTTCAGATSALP